MIIPFLKHKYDFLTNGYTNDHTDGVEHIDDNDHPHDNDHTDDFLIIEIIFRPYKRDILM